MLRATQPHHCQYQPPEVLSASPQRAVTGPYSASARIHSAQYRATHCSAPGLTVLSTVSHSAVYRHQPCLMPGPIILSSGSDDAEYWTAIMLSTRPNCAQRWAPSLSVLGSSVLASTVLNTGPRHARCRAARHCSPLAVTPN